MKTNDISVKELLELYFAGETTLAQERQLRDYFAGEGTPNGKTGITADVAGAAAEGVHSGIPADCTGEIAPAELEYARAMFGFFGSAAQDSCSSELRLSFEQGPSPAGTVLTPDEWMPLHRGMMSAAETEVESIKLSRQTKVRRMRFIRRAVSIASVVLIAAAGIIFGVVDSQKPVIYCYVNGEPVTDFDYASRQAEMAVRILAGNMKTSSEGIDTAVDAGRQMERLGRALQIIDTGHEEENI